MAAEAEGQFSIGQVIPGTPYRVRGLIGAGGMGSVYEVEHDELGKLFVLKALRPQLLERRDLAARMKNEWRALGRLEHPNIVLVTDAGRTSNGVPFYVMERLAGETLAVRLRRDGPLGLAPSMRVAAAILDALAAAHAIGVVHRDIKPQNVFLPSGGGIKLLDFGVAKLRDQAAMVVTRRGVAIGTPRYMSPEQAEGNAVDGRADVYAVGLVLFELIAGRGPFAHHREPSDLVLAHISEAPPRLDTVRPEVPAELADLLQRWLSKEPADRPLDAGVAAGELRRMMGRFGPEVAPSGDDPTPDVDYDATTRGPECHPALARAPWSSATRTAPDRRHHARAASRTGRADPGRRGSQPGERRSETPPPAVPALRSRPGPLPWLQWVTLAGAASLATFGLLFAAEAAVRGQPPSVFVAPAVASSPPTTAAQPGADVKLATRPSAQPAIPAVVPKSSIEPGPGTPAPSMGSIERIDHLERGPASRLEPGTDQPPAERKRTETPAPVQRVAAPQERSPARGIDGPGARPPTVERSITSTESALPVQSRARPQTSTSSASPGAPEPSDEGGAATLPTSSLPDGGLPGSGL